MAKNLNRADPHGMAVAVLTFLAADPERLGRFFSLTGLDPATLRATSATPSFARAMLAYLGTDDTLLVAFAQDAGLDPAEVGQAVRHATEADVADL